MTWQQRASAWIAANTRLVDLLLVIGVLALGLISAAINPVEGSERASDLVAYALTVVASLTLWWRRSHPLLMLPLGGVFVITFWILDYTGAVDVALWVLFYSATRHGGPDRRRVWQIVGLTLAAILTVATIGVIVPTEDLPLIAIVGIFIIHGTAAVIGEALYQRSRHVAELEARAEMLEADLETKAALAAVEERTRIAREMHDIIAHGMSAIVVQAQGAQRLVHKDPDKVAEVLGTIAGIGRDSSDEMRRMLGVLREPADSPEFAPQPDLDDLEGLRRHACDAGVETTIEITGPRRPLPPGLELTGYRVVQEALTNVVRHGGRPASAHVAVTFGEAAVEIVVNDDGLGAAALPDNAGTGHGLLGMRERVEIYNGRLTSGPRAGGGWQVHALLPLPADRSSATTSASSAAGSSDT